MPLPQRNALRDTMLPLVLLTGDTVVTFAGLSLGYWLRYDSPVRYFGVQQPNAHFGSYAPLLLVGVALLIGAYSQLGLYETRLVVRRYQSLGVILKGAGLWLAAYLGLSLVLKFEPPISRVFVLLGFGCVVTLLYIWRGAFYAALIRSGLFNRLRQRTVLLGWNEHARALATEIARDATHPFTLLGAVATGTSTPPFSAPGAPPVPDVPLLGGMSELESILRRTTADLLIISRADLSRVEVEQVVETCERAYVEWKIVPGSFDIFLSGLRLQTVGRVPLLGVEELAINRLFNRGLKRACDIVGALVGLVITAPVMLVLAVLIKRESPRGPVFFRQVRVGAGHSSFTLLKLRSMVADAPPAEATRWSTARNDPRVLHIGAFMRRWNLDEVPQYWNVLRGDMSLVGPRPEIPHHVDNLSTKVPHYLPRHIVKPGMTGWAQVNGLRGDTSVTDRIQHDIYYIENWSVWLDVQIMLLTFVRWKNAY
jgi:exopolysaccharide biosynthesis polyprenyl glycosylphosphotransferase